jgi:S1-C subfamily serine protease
MRKRASRFLRGLVLFSALIGAAGFAGPKQEEPTPGTGSDTGVLVVKVEPGSPAARSGIARGDIILAIDGADVATAAEMLKVLAPMRPGDKVKVTVRHGDAKRTLTAELGESNGRADLGVYFEPPAAAGATPRPDERPAPDARPAPRPAPDTRPGPGTHPMPRANPLPRILARAGAQITGVTTGSPADKAGLERGDVITAVDGTILERDDNLAEMIGAHKPGDTITIEVLGTDRDSREVTVALGKNPQDASQAWLGVQYRMAFRIEGTTPWTGRLPITLGVRVTGVTEGGPAAKAGIERGDLLTSIDGMAVWTAREVLVAIGSRKPGNTVTVHVARAADGSEADFEVTLAEDPADRAKSFLGVQLGGPWLAPGWPGGQGFDDRAPKGHGGDVPGGAAPGGTDA